MTCGACHPEALEDEMRGRVFGYAVASHPSKLARQTRRLYFLGASLVYTDKPDGKVANRNGFRCLLRVSRDGDTIILADKRCFGRDRPGTHIERLEAAGIHVNVMKPEP